MKQLTDEEFEIIVNKYTKTLLTIAYNYIRDFCYAEDIVQEVFLKFYRAHKTFENEEHIKFWLIRVTINQSLNVKKRKEKELLVSDEYIINLPDTSDADEKNEEIYNCICALKESYRTIILLYFYDKYSLKEIASILKISENNAIARFNRAKKKLKEIILEGRKQNE